MKHIFPFWIYESQTSSGLTPEQKDFLNRNTHGTWIVNPTTGLVDIRGDFAANHDGLKNFLGIKFGNVTGNFLCRNNQLQSLEGVPQKVGGDFDCVRSQLQSLEGAPQEVVGNFLCRNNQLQSLEGAPREVGGDFNCSRNQLQSLKGAPQEVVGNFDCSMNQLKYLEGAPREVGGDFDFSENQIQSLEGKPQEVGGNFISSFNQLQSLEGSPREVHGNFDCSGNELQSLEGAPEKVYGDFLCTSKKNGIKLQSLIGAPKQINGEFWCDRFHFSRPGEWSMEACGKILGSEKHSQKAKELILTLPFFNSTYWNSKISENPESAILELSEFWDDMPDFVRNSIRIPSNLKDDFENLLELVRSGIM